MFQSAEKVLAFYGFFDSLWCIEEIFLARAELEMVMLKLLVSGDGRLRRIDMALAFENLSLN